jgi:hypothetical protein
MASEPNTEIEDEGLFAPEHAGQALSHNGRGFRIHRGRSERSVEFVRLSNPDREGVVEVCEWVLP